MRKESDILFEKGTYWVCKARHGVEVYKIGITHSTRCASINLGSREKDMEKALQEIERRVQLDEVKRT